MNESVQAYIKIICDRLMPYILSENLSARKISRLIEASSTAGRLHIGSFYNIISLYMKRLGMI